MNGAANVGMGGIPEVLGDPKQLYYTEKAALYFRDIALEANHANTCIDVFCCGLKTFHVKVGQ